MVKILFLVLMCVGFGVTFTQAQNEDCHPATGQAIEIGAVFPSDNLFATEAGAYLRGVQAMVAAINSCGGVNGKRIDLRHFPANNRESAEAAVRQLTEPLVIGSGATIVRDVLNAASQTGDFVYWEVTEPLDYPGQQAFSPRPNSYQLGQLAAEFINTEVIDSVLGGDPLRLAVIDEDSSASSTITSGLVDSLTIHPVISQHYALASGRDLAVKIREMGINVVVVNTFENQADRFWYQMRQADSNVKAWIQVGGDQYRRHMCPQFGNVDGLITISATGQVNSAFRQLVANPVYDRYQMMYEQMFGELPGERADLGASGTYLLLRHVLPQVTNFSVDEVNMAITVASGSGLMGEALHFDGGANQLALASIQQAQLGQFCSIMPGGVGTCNAPLQTFPTWRERAVAAETAMCRSW